MDATLVFLEPGLFFLFTRRSARRDPATTRQRSALGGDLRQSRELIELIDDSATKLFDLGEGVHFASAIRGHQQLPDFHRHVGGSEVPVADGVMPSELVGTRTYHYVLQNQSAALMIAYLRLSGFGRVVVLNDTWNVPD